MGLLRDRPSELPEFVAYMESTWQHMQDGTGKRKEVMLAKVGNECSL